MNAARDLAATGTPGPWHQEPDTHAGRVWVTADRRKVLSDLEPMFQVRTADEYATREADAGKIVRAVNALPAIADYDDAVMAYLKHQTGCHIPAWCPDLARLWRELTAARDAVAAALTGETP